MNQGAPGTAYDGLIIDLDGVVLIGGRPVEGSPQAVAAFRDRGIGVVFLTNDPQSSRDEHAARLVAIGIPARASDIVSSAAATARFMAAQDHLAGAGVFAMGSASLRGELVQAGFGIVPPADAKHARAVVVAGHRGFDYEELRAATIAVLSGAELYATGRDAIYPTPDGPAPATGAILAAVETATGVTATVIGKPEPYVFEIARESLPGCEQVAVVGDNLASDIAGAKRAGLDAILVLTGMATRADLAAAAFQPDLVVASLADLAAR
jgi:glycerol-1-phosphatase